MVRFIVHIDHMVDLNLAVQQLVLSLLFLKVVALAFLLFIGIKRAHASCVWGQGSGLEHLEGARPNVLRDAVIPCVLSQAFVILVIFLLNRGHLLMEGPSDGAAVELVISEVALFDTAISQG